MNASSRLGEELAGTPVSPTVALALLHALRHTDTPAETLEDEDLARSLPRRLGLSRAVDAQIRRYEDLTDGRGTLPAGEVADLFELVARRPDADAVFGAAGRWFAARQLRKRRVTSHLVGIPLPAVIRLRLALRVSRAVARLVSPGGTTRLERDPAALVLEGSLPARASRSSHGCELIAAVLARSLEAHRFEREETDGGDGPVLHPICEARGDGACVWRPAARGS